MSKLRDLGNKLLSATPEKQKKDLLGIIRSHEAEAVDLNIEQMMAGQDSDGNRITPEYAPFTIEIKKAKGQPYDRVTLKDEGDFHRSMFMKADNFPVMFDSKDSKTDDLTRKYGNSIFGLTKQHLGDFKEDISEDVKKYYRDLLSI